MVAILSQGAKNPHPKEKSQALGAWLSVEGNPSKGTVSNWTIWEEEDAQRSTYLNMHMFECNFNT